MHCSLPIDVKSNLYLSRENLYKSDPNLETGQKVLSASLTHSGQR